MKKAIQKTNKRRAFFGMLALVLVLGAGLFAEDLSIVSHAESAAKVTASSAKIRKSADSSSEVVGSATKDKTISIKSQTKGADGYTWYEVYVDANTLGYIRSDLVSITDGSTPPSSSGSSSSSTSTSTSTTTTTTTVQETPVDVTAVEPQSATVTGGQSVRVRSNASTTSQIVTTAESGMALTVTGQATGTDGKTWYQVNFISNNTEVTGFIRSDYVQLSGELQTPAEEQPTEETPTEEQPVEDTTTTSKDWDTQLQGDSWYLLDMVGQQQYKIEDLFNSLNQISEINTQYTQQQKTIKGQKIAIIFLIIALVIAAGGVALLIFKIKDMNDSAYFSDVEKETVRRRNMDRPQTGRAAPQGARGAGARAQGARPQTARPQGGQKVMHNVGAEERPAARPAGRPMPQNGSTPQQRPATGRPAAPQGNPVNRPAAPQGERPTARPAAQNGVTQGKAPQTVQRPAGRPAAPQGTRPQAAPAETPRGNAPQARPAAKPQAERTQDPGWKSKNFMSDDDEFEFEFLNWEGDEEQ